MYSHFSDTGAVTNSFQLFFFFYLPFSFFACVFLARTWRVLIYQFRNVFTFVTSLSTRILSFSIYSISCNNSSFLANLCNFFNFCDLYLIRIKRKCSYVQESLSVSCFLVEPFLPVHQSIVIIL